LNILGVLIQEIARPVPPPPRAAGGLTPGEDSDDELSIHARSMSLREDSEAPPPPSRSLTHDTTVSRPAFEKRASRGPPPIPGSLPQQSAPQTRPPPPPPPGPLSRSATSESKASAVPPIPSVGADHEDEELTEYDGDYDTDIASSAKHKDALRSHERDSSNDLTDDTSLQSPRGPPETRPPPPPPPNAPRAVPPPPPNQPPRSRPSMDAPRAPPPPLPPSKEESFGDEDDDEYDPYRYAAGRPGGPPPPLPSTAPPARTKTDPVSPPVAPAGNTFDSLYDASPTESQPRGLPPPSNENRPRASLDAPRTSGNMRRSMDIPRPAGDVGYMATDVDLGESSYWWTQPNTPPPVFQNRKDLIYEIDESTSSRRGGKQVVSREIYVLFMDYSQMTVTARFDAKNPGDVSFEQRHEPPPNKPRQDQLESAHTQFGSRISEAVNAVQNTVVADGTPHGLLQHVLSPLNNALLPVGTRAYGALVYANLANASVQQNDEIRPGDIVSFRNARFQGHRGTMHQKYHIEIGKSEDHVAIVVDWDGTKKKVHAFEQGRESKKVKVESFRLGDLKSGECKVWRVMPRSWVGWETSK
jgi:hypothetical protein